MKIFVLQDSQHIGDNANALAVGKEIVKHRPDCQLFPVDESQRMPVQNYIHAHPLEQFLIIGAGAHELAELASYNKYPNVMTSWSGHQLNASLEAYADNIDSIHVPAYAASHALKVRLKDKLITTPYGVPHLKSRETSLNAYESMAENHMNIPEARHYIAVALGGNAPDEQGTMKHYSQEEAYALGQWVGWQAANSDAAVLATDGPRTDMVATRAFLQGLKNAGVTQEKTAFFPYLPDKKSALDSIMGAVINHPGSYAFIPADSSSMITESIEQLTPGQTIIYTTSATNNTHKKQSDIAFNHGYAHRIDPVSLSLETITNPANKPAPSATENVAEHLIQRLAQKERQLVSTPAYAFSR